MSATAEPIPERLRPLPREAPVVGEPERGGSAGGTAWRAIAWLVILPAIGWLFWPSLRRLPPIWDIDPNYSHGYFVPLLALVFAFRAWRQQGWPVQAAVGWPVAVEGMIRIALGLAGHAVSLFAEVLLFDVLAMVLVLTGMLKLLGGREVLRAYGFSAWFLVFMAPIPTAWYEPLAIRMQQITSATSALLLEVCQVPVFREGYFIHLPGYDMEVGAACSGLRQLAAMFALGLCIGHVAGRGRGYTVALGLLSLPIAVAANCFRVVLTGFILMWFGREAADGVFHELEGLAVVGVAAAMMLATAWLLSKFGSQAAASDSGK